VCIYLLVCVKQARADVKREREEKNAQRICMCGTETFTRPLDDKLWTIRKRKRMLVRIRRIFLFTYKNEGEKSERKEKIGRKIRKEREWDRCVTENYRQLLLRAVKVINHHRFLAYYTYKRSQVKKVRTRMKGEYKACQISTFTFLFFFFFHNLDSSQLIDIFFS